MGVHLRALFLLLLFANLLFFAWSRGYLGHVDDGREPLRPTQQVNAAKLRVLLSPSGSETPAVASDCRAIGGLRPADGQKLLALVGKQLPDASAQLSRPKPPEIWDVVITAISGRGAADAKQAELKKLGVTDLRLMEEKPGEFTLRLGSDARKADAEARLQMLSKKGVKTAKVVQRSPADEVIALVRGPVAALSRLPELARGFAGSSLLECPSN